MMEDKIKKILEDEKSLESLLEKAMNEVGDAQDGELIDDIAEMSEEDFRKMIAKTSSNYEEKTSSDCEEKTEPVAEKTPAPVKPLFSRAIFLRAIAACAVLVLILVGINYIEIGSTDSAAYASLFNTYYKGDKVDWKTYDAGDDKLNAAGGLSTAGVLEEATRLMSQKSARKNREGIRRLENLLTLNYKKSLEHEIRWYLGLGYLRDAQISKARREFQRVIDLHSSHSADAKKILEEL